MAPKRRPTPSPSPPQKAPAAAAPAGEEAAAAAKAAGATATVTVAGADKPGAAAESGHSNPPKKRPELARVQSAGLVSNDSLQETEVEHFFAPEAALEEEERLRKEREERQQDADPPSEVCLVGGRGPTRGLQSPVACHTRTQASLPRLRVQPGRHAPCSARLPCPVGLPPSRQAQAALDQAKFSQLEALLNRSQMYTQFLTEQVRLRV
jgi:hypothetical protein